MRAILPILFFLVSSSCHINYTFSGASTNAKTITVRNILNQAPLVVPSLSQSFTEALKQKFISSINVELVESGGELEFSGAVTNYQITPVAAQANEIAALNRLSITVSIEFVNRLEEAKSWTSTFSRFADYDSGKDLTSIQEQLIEEINEQLVEDIFNKAVVNW